MTLGLRGKLFLLLLGLTVAVVGAADAYLSGVLDRQLTDNIRADLEVRLAFIEAELSRAGLPLDAGLDRVVDDAGAHAHVRVTLVRKDGAVLGDSELSGEGLASVENHGDRPEVIEALRSGRGASIRYSTTLGRRMMYVAAPLRQGGEVVGVVRAARPLAEVDAALASLHRTLLSATLVALVVAAALSLLAAHRLSRAVGELTEASARMAAGDLTVRTRTTGTDELAQLGRGLEQLASNLSNAMTALKAERDLLGRLIDSMKEGLLLLDAGGCVARVNPALRELLLLAPDAVGKSLLEVVRHAELQQLCADARSAGAPLDRELDMPGLKPRRVLVQAMPLSEPGELLAVFVDVTEIRRLERVRTDFVANLSHELRTPITAIRGYAETLQGGALESPETAARMVDIIHRQSERLSQLVADLLELSKLEAKELELARAPVALQEAVGRAADAVRPKAQSKRIRLELRVPPDLRATGDERTVEQVVLNLLDNAVKYTPEGGSVEVEGRLEGERCVLEVRDSGIGIEAKHLPRIFERFYRADPGRSRELGGTGLGLSIVKHLVAALRGEVTVESQPGVGTTFRVALPRE